MNIFKYLIAALGGFQFGYAIGIMAGAILFISTQFSLTPDQQGTVVSSFLMGALPGAAIAGKLSNWLGRKRGQQVAAILFFIGAMLLFKATSIPILITGRIIQGLAAGLVAVITPMFIAEVCPSEKRGVYVSFYQLAVTLGLFVAYTVNLVLSGHWQWMLGLAALPAIVHFLGFFSIQEAPLTQENKSSWRVFFEPEIRFALIVVILLNVFQQISGINAVIYFAPSICQSCGFKATDLALLSSVAIGLVNFCMTVLSIKYIDTLGRRFLLLMGTGGMVVSLMGFILAPYVFQGPALPWISIISILIYISSFAIGLGPMPQLVGAELFPRKVRGQGISIGGISNWIFNFLVVSTFMNLNSKFSTAGAFSLYAFFSILAFYFVWKFVPETKGKIID